MIIAPQHAALAVATDRPSVFDCADTGSLTAIFEPEIQIAVLRRKPLAAIDTFLNEAIRGGTLKVGFRCPLTAGEGLPISRLPTGANASALADDISSLAEIYCDLIGCPQVGIRLEVLQRAMCPRFHVDHVGIRLLCTYRGSGTEYLDGSNADRSKLGRGAQGLDDDSSGLIRDQARIDSVPSHAIALLKGDAWQGNGGQGAIHRSPDQGVWPRVVLAIDAIW